MLIVCSTTWLTTVLLSYCVSGIHCILVEYHDSVPSYPICPQSHPCLTDCTAVLMIRPKSCPVYYSVYPFLTQCSAACLTISVLSCPVLSYCCSSHHHRLKKYLALLLRPVLSDLLFLMSLPHRVKSVQLSLQFCPVQSLFVLVVHRFIAWCSTVWLMTLSCIVPCLVSYLLLGISLSSCPIFYLSCPFLTRSNIARLTTCPLLTYLSYSSHPFLIGCHTACRLTPVLPHPAHGNNGNGYQNSPNAQ